MELNIWRKIWHVTWGIIILLTAFYILPPTRVYFAIGLYFVVLAIEIVHLQKSGGKGFLFWLMKKISREEERSRFSSAHWFALGCLIVSFLPGQTIPCLVAIYLGFCDPIAEIVGRKWKIFSFSWGKKSFGGSLAFFFSAYILSMLFFGLVPNSHAWEISLAGSLLAATAETVEINLVGQKVGDNFMIPASSVVLYFLLKISGLL